MCGCDVKPSMPGAGPPRRPKWHVRVTAPGVEGNGLAYLPEIAHAIALNSTAAGFPTMIAALKRAREAFEASA